ncbi:MAG: hypothetical protein ACD_54C00654G0001 [uncultured bacterium]|nr:MAG: hypothetical protein ACD_54C00654G0001 [uncultured bacterium]
MIQPRPLPDKATETQIGLDQGRRPGQRRLAIQLFDRDQVHRQSMFGPCHHAQGGRGKMMVMQIGQGLRQRGNIGAVEGRHAKQHLDLPIQHILGQRVPQMKHRRATAIIGMHARSAQLQQPPPRGFQCRQIIFGLRIEPPRQRQTVRGEQPVDTHHILQRFGVATGVDQQQVVEIGVKLILFDLRIMINQRARAAQFLHKDPVTQPLRRAQIAGILGQSERKGNVVSVHRSGPAVRATLCLMMRQAAMQPHDRIPRRVGISGLSRP